VILRLTLFLLIFSNAFAQNFIPYSSTKNKNDTIKIAVVFHIIGNDSLHKRFDRDFLDNILSEVNHRMNNVIANNIDSPFDSIIGKPNIELYISDFDKNCNKIEPITYSIDDSYIYTPFISENSIWRKGYYKPEEFLNIWVCNITGNKIYGHTPFRNRLNGIVIDEKSFITIEGVQERVWTLVHELGHWLDLPHIWGGFDSENDFDDCLTDDGISDTPKQEDPHLYDFSFVQDSCDGIGKTNHQNFMDYSNDTGMFTEEQVEVMRDYLKIKRTGLIWRTSCVGNNETTLVTGSFKDNRDNQSYSWVQIGKQRWMSENINYDLSGSACYNNDPNNCAVYGRLYNWNDAQKVCPKGWRLPSKTDWGILIESIGRKPTQVKSKFGWNNNNGTNYSGLNFLPSGYKQTYRYYKGKGILAKIWLSDSKTWGYSRQIGGIYKSYDKIPDNGSSNKKELLSCRCIQDVN